MEPTATAEVATTAAKVVMLDSSTLIWCGSIFLGIVGFLLKWFFDRLTKVVDNRLAQRDREEAQFRKEQEEDTIHDMIGRQIVCDCLHELIYAVLHNEHNGGLEKVSDDLEKFRDKNDRMIMGKAARYKLQVER